MKAYKCEISIKPCNIVEAELLTPCTATANCLVPDEALEMVCRETPPKGIFFKLKDKK